MQLPIYLDYMATTPVDPRVTSKIIACLEQSGNFGNPASQTHQYGWHAHAAIENARQQVASLINADPREIIWTSGATEANNLALKGAAIFYQRKGKHIITCQTEHKSVLDPCRYLERQGFDVTYLPVQKNGLLDLNELQNAIRDDTILISIMQVNNEIGVIQDIAAISALARPRGILTHVDAAQSAGKIAIDLQQLINVDLMTFTAHKVYGPKGIGALYIRRNPRVRLEALIHGGGHEQGLRSGTLATHQIVGMGEAFQIAKENLLPENQRILQLRDRLWNGIKKLGDVYLNGDFKQRVASNLNVSFAGVNGEVLLPALKDLAVATGSACTSASVELSHVLRAIGCNDELARSTIRFSLGRFTTVEEIDFAITQINEVISQLRRK